MRNIRRSIAITRRQQGWFFIKRTHNEGIKKDIKEDQEKVS